VRVTQTKITPQEGQRKAAAWLAYLIRSAALRKGRKSALVFGSLVYGLVAIAAANPAGYFTGLMGARLRLAPATPAADSVWTGLAAYYGLDGNAYDEVSGNTGTWPAAVSNAPSAISGGAAFVTAAAGSYVSTVNSNLLDGASNATISAWVYSIGVSAGDDPGIVFAYRASPATIVGIRQTSGTATNHHAIVGTLKTQNHGATTTNVYQHICAVYQTGGFPVKIYVDGVLAAQSSSVLSSVIAQKAQFLVGSGLAGGRLWRGYVDEVGIWPRALSSTEVYRIATEKLIYRAP
jgi:hypothetical protein